MIREDMDELIRLANLNREVVLTNIKQPEGCGWVCDIFTPTGVASVNFFPYGVNVVQGRDYPVNERRLLITKPEGNHIL